jgi:hypothetical protein
MQGFGFNIILSKSLFFFHPEQSDVIFINFQTFHVAVVCKGYFIFICASTVLECSCSRIHRYVAAQYLHIIVFRWAFKMYDSDNSGKIEVKEMVNVMKVEYFVNIKPDILR